MTVAEAKYIAQQYVSKMGEVIPGFRFGIGNTEEFTNNYYFDFIWLTLNGETPKNSPLAGGARGLSVNKHNRQVSSLSHGEYSSLRNEEVELTNTYELLLDFKNGNMHLQELKAKFGLTSEQLLKFSKIIKDIELNREATYTIRNSILSQLKDDHFGN